jgi:hypothetical protein
MRDRLRQIADWLKDVTYRPDWTIESYENWNGPGVRVTMHVLNTYHPDEPKLSLPMPMAIPESVRTQADFYDWLLGLLLWMEEHECQEWFKVRGKPWCDPHEAPFHAYDGSVNPNPMTLRVKKLRTGAWPDVDIVVKYADLK